jgi:hypothetical protein
MVCLVTIDVDVGFFVRRFGSRPDESQPEGEREYVVFVVLFGSVWLFRLLKSSAGFARQPVSYFFEYLIFVVPIVPLKANGAWSK